MTDHEKNFIILGKGYVSLLYLRTQYEIAEKEPPDDLTNGIATFERQIRHISDELE
jgi:hypothetical protein